MTAERVTGGYRVRLRYGRDAATGKPQRDRFLLVLPHTPEGELHAADRERRLQVTAAALAKLRSPSAREHLIEMGKLAADERAFRALERAVEKLVAEAAAAPPAVASGPVTFRDVAELWTSGKLTELYPDSPLLPPKDDKGRANDRAIVSVFYPVLGAKPVADITLDDLDEACRRIPKDAHYNTRRNYRIKLRLVLRIAAGPLRLMSAVPALEIPRKRASDLFGYLYPQEEQLLLSCTAIPLVYRMLYGYLARNGCRVGESLQLTWDHVDLETGDIHIDKRWTKTKRARRWVLDSDVAEALEGWHRISGLPKGPVLVFPGRGGKKISIHTPQNRLRSDLRLAGVTRQSLLEPSDGAEPLRVHDLRASFITLALRAGRSHKWIMTRTGHEKLGTLSIYDRLVEDANEHHLPAWFAPMAQSIPELRPAKGGPRVGQTPQNAQEMALITRSAWTPEPGIAGQKPAEKAPSVTTETPLPPTSGPAEFQGVGQAGPAGGPASGGTDTATPEESVAVILARIEESLASDLKVAIAAGRYELAERLLAELGERRRARTAPQVTSLEAARAKRDKGEGK
jgi:integrase